MSMLDTLKHGYVAIYWQSIDDDARQHLAQFVEHCRADVEALEQPEGGAPALTVDAATAFLIGLGWKLQAPEGNDLMPMDSPALGTITAEAGQQDPNIALADAAPAPAAPAAAEGDAPQA